MIHILRYIIITARTQEHKSNNNYSDTTIKSLLKGQFTKDKKGLCGLKLSLSLLSNKCEWKLVADAQRIKK